MRPHDDDDADLGGAPSLLSRLEHAGRAHPARTALSCEGDSLSYAALNAEANRAARALLGAGVRAGDRVAYLGRTSLTYFTALLGAFKIGATFVPVNWRLSTAEARAVLDDCEPSLLLIESEFAAAGDPAAAGYRHPPMLVGRDAGPGGWPAATRSASELGWADEPARDDDVALQIYTSGTTGQAKGAMMTHRGLRRYLATLADVVGVGPDSVTLSPLPLFHIGGTCWPLMGLYLGAHSVLTVRAEPVHLLTTAASLAVTEMLVVPTIIRSLLEAAGRDGTSVSSLKTLYYGAGPISEFELTAALAVFKCGFVQGFGMTECGIISALSRADHLRGGEYLRSCGRPVANTEIRIVDAVTRRDVAPGEAGEIWVRSPIVMSGYWKQPLATAQALTPDGWLRTGDAARRDPAGYLFLADRIKDIIISGGENIYPAEVESALLAHPDVRDCTVIGVPSRKWTETVTAIVVTREGATVSPDDLIGFCRDRLARYKCPTTVTLTDSIPRNAAGKVLKFQLRAQYARPEDSGR